MSLLKEIEESWGWVGIIPDEIVSENKFGNLIIKDNQNRFWRLCPEDVYCEIVANSIDDYNKLIHDNEFLEDWHMASMVEEAEQMLGTLKDNFKYHMVIPGVLGGEYGGKNIKSAPLIELIRFSGDLGKQIKDLPEGSNIELKLVD